MSGYYAITATVVDDREGWNAMRQVPTFYLDPNVQGIVSEDHAIEIARVIIDPFDFVTVHATAVLVNGQS